ncbi:glycosyl hydrolase [Microbacterium sp. MC2]
MDTHDDERPLHRRLWQAFTDPSDEARPRVWWHWMDGNVDSDGLEADLRWLHRVGVRGVQIFDGGMGVPLVVDEPVRPGTDAWRAAMRRVRTVAAELGMEVAVATSSGWSAAGAPWVQPADAMKKLVWSETVIDGDGPVDIELAPLPDVEGLYQDSARWGATDPRRWCVDWRVVAVPASPEQEPLHPARMAHGDDAVDAEVLVDGSFERAIRLPRSPDRWSEAFITQQFDEPVTVTAVTVGLPGPRGFGAAPSPDAVLQWLDDDGIAHDIVALAPTGIPARTASFPPVTARAFRLALSGASAAEALPPMADGVRMPPVLRSADAFEVTQFALHPRGRVHHAEAKAGFGVVADYDAVDTPIAAGVGAVQPDEVLDLTAFVEGGRLRWTAPAGRWRVLRFGASLTGQTNGPAPADATGLEVDKLDGARVAAYLDRHLAHFAPEGADALLSDSIEAGPQNWTDAIADRFRDRCSYDLTDRLPALAGYVVGSAPESDRFLSDYRRTLVELLAAEYYGTLAAQARRRGMTSYAEALEDARPQLGDDLAMRSHADVPMGAMWTFPPHAGPRPTYVADLKGASSVAHVYGRRWTGAESFTAFDEPWSSTPGSLKHVADLQLALGVTRFCIHTSPHQPLAAPPPGIALAPFLGQVFTRHETWSALAGPWIDYLARCSAVLSAGRPDVQVAVFVGEEAPVTGLFAERFDRAVPSGYDFDYIGPDALREVVRVDGGDLVAEGARYRVLLLSGSSHRLTVATVERIADLVDAGATVVGRRPDQSPSLADDAHRFRRACDRIWDAGRPNVHDTDDVAGVLAGLGEQPGPVRDEGVRVISRLVDGERITFVANPDPAPRRVRVHTDAPMSVWDPVSVTTTPLPATDEGGLLELPPFGSAFLVPAAGPADEPLHEAGRAHDWRVTPPGGEPTALGADPRPWTELDPGRSGVATYRATLTVTADAAQASRAELCLGELAGVARVRLDGEAAGIVWTAPWRLDVTGRLREGPVSIEIDVANPWRNRLIGEATAASGELFAPMTTVFEPDAAPLPAGLSGGLTLWTSAPHH